MRTAVIVLGDLGRSPRMQFHALSLAQAGVDVDLVGFEGAPVHAAVAGQPRITEHRLPDPDDASRTSGGVRRFIVLSVFRAVRQALTLLSRMRRLARPDVILVQNPPAVPALAVAWMVARLRGARLVIDWHNLAHTVVAVRLGEGHRAVRSLARSERRWARRADAHFAVSQALAAWLAREYGVKAAVLYDRPLRAFAAPTTDQVRTLTTKLVGQGLLPAERVPLVVCPTSWTPDEDFDLLLEALERAERALVGGSEPSAFAQGASADKSAFARGASADKSGSPKLSLMLTGRGALRENFEARVAKRSLSAIIVRTTWLEPADYPTLIGMADLGLCLHQSSSGLDLPMKLADFRGPGVPVAAFDYAPVLGEALTSGKQGVTFRDPGQLANLFVALATGATPAAGPLAQSRAWIAANPASRWEDQWHDVAAPVCSVTPG